MELPFKERQRKGGPKLKLAIEDILLMNLTCYRDYPTFFSLDNVFRIDESNDYRWVTWTEAILSIAFDGIVDIRLLDEASKQLVDVTECTIQRPKNYDVQREYYSGKKKKRTIKAQIIMNEKDKKIVFVCFAKGSVHDFTIFKNTTG